MSGGGDGSTVLEVGVDEATLPLLEKLEGVVLEGPGAQGRMRLRLAPDVTPNAVARAIIEAGHALHAMVPTGRTLEDVFMELTR